MALFRGPTNQERLALLTAFVTADNNQTSANLVTNACMLHMVSLALGNDAASARIALVDSTALADVSGSREAIWAARVASGVNAGFRAAPLVAVFNPPLAITGGLRFEGTATGSISVGYVPVS